MTITTFRFYRAKGAPAVQQFFKLETGDGPLSRPERVALFSGGLDSLAGAVEDRLRGAAEAVAGKPPIDGQVLPAA